MSSQEIDNQSMVNNQILELSNRILSFYLMKEDEYLHGLRLVSSEELALFRKENIQEGGDLKKLSEELQAVFQKFARGEFFEVENLGNEMLTPVLEGITRVIGLE